MGWDRWAPSKGRKMLEASYIKGILNKKHVIVKRKGALVAWALPMFIIQTHLNFYE